MNHFVYILECRDKSLYTGYTISIERRVREHNESKLGAKSIKGKLPAVLVYYEIFNTISEALRREREIKALPRIKKLALIEKAPLLRNG